MRLLGWAGSHLALAGAGYMAGVEAAYTAAPLREWVALLGIAGMVLFVGYAWVQLHEQATTGDAGADG